MKAEITAGPEQSPQEPFDPIWYMQAYPDVKALGMDPYSHFRLYGKLLGRTPLPRERRLKRIVMVVPDISTIGGISSRTRKVLFNSVGRPIEYRVATARSERGGIQPGEVCCAGDSDAFLQAMEGWYPNDTAMVISNNAIRVFPARVREHLQKFPIVYIAAGQMAFMVQDSNILGDKNYVAGFRAMRIMSFSDADISFQRQLGIHGQVKGFVPVEQRESNDFDPAINTRVGYVGRIDFHAKDAGRLVEIASCLKGSRWGPLKVFTTDGRNSPQYLKLREMIESAGLEDQFEFVINCSDKATIFGELAALLVPSRKESFGNSIVEAMSFGVPVVAASYAPGPSEIIEHGKSGFLLDSYTGEAVADVLSRLDDDSLRTMSAHAFSRHKRYRIEDHLDQLELLAAEAVAEFRGENTLPVFPELKLVQGMK